MPFAKIRTAEERFWEKVDKNGPVYNQELGQCWIWTGSKLPTGYGRFWDGEKVIGAHWFLLDRPLAKGEVSRHQCHTPSCVRGSHILIGSQQENMGDMMEAGRHNPTGLSGSLNPFSKLTEEQARLAKACPKKFGAITRMAEILGVAYSVVSRIQLGKGWVHLPPSSEEDMALADEMLRYSSKHGREGTISAKLTEEQAILCKACPTRYGAAARLARGLDVCIAAVCNIRDGKNWEWLPPTTKEDKARAEAFLATLPASPLHWRKRQTSLKTS